MEVVDFVAVGWYKVVAVVVGNVGMNGLAEVYVGEVVLVMEYGGLSVSAEV